VPAGTTSGKIEKIGKAVQKKAVSAWWNQRRKREAIGTRCTTVRRVAPKVAPLVLQVSIP
jgi:hypothetical protein